jgi:hypothetical protein
MKALKWLAVIIILLAIAGCTASKITSTWKRPGSEPKHYNKILVLGMMREADRSVQQKMESHLAGDLQSLGYNSISAYAAYGPRVGKEWTDEKISKRFGNEGYDAVLTIILLNKKKEKYYVPAKMQYTPYNMYQDQLWGYYRSLETRIESPGYYNETTRYFWESNFYDVASGQLVYSVQTQSFDPASTDALAHDYGERIVKNIIDNNVIKVKKVVKEF